MVMEFNSIARKDNEKMGFWLERKFDSLIKLSSQITKEVEFPNKENLLEIIKAFDIFYYEEVVKQREKAEGPYWEISITSEEIVDYFYGTDFIVNYRGYLYALDITTNKDELTQKLNSKNIIAIKKALGVDYVCVLYWNIRPEKMYTSKEFAELIFNFKTQLKEVKDKGINTTELITL